MHSGSLRSEAFIEGSTVAAAAMTWYQERHELEIKVRIRNTVSAKHLGTKAIEEDP
jgi:hypothetical protein